MKFVPMLMCVVMLQGCGATFSKSEARCKGYGYKENTDAFRDCFAAEERSRRERQTTILSTLNDD